MRKNFKRTLACFLAVIMCICVLPMGNLMANAVSASGQCGDSVYWSLDGNGTLTIIGTGAMYQYNYSDNKSPFYGNTSIKNVVIENDITDIGHLMFYQCANISTVEIPNSVTKIFTGAFAGCSSLTSITIPIGVTKIYEGAFSDCKSLTKVDIPYTIETISAGAFSNCRNLTDVYYTGSYEHWNSISIGTDNDYLINAQLHIGKDLTNVQCGDNVYCSLDKNGTLFITGDGAMWNYGDKNGPIHPDEALFFRNPEIKNVIISNGITSIGNWSFYTCNNIESIEIPNSVTDIGIGTFTACGNLKNIKIPNGVNSINFSVFAACISLTNIEIPNSVISIGEDAFAICNNLTSVKIPKNVISIGEHALGYNEDIMPINNFTIYGEKGTAAENYAKENNFTFIDINPKPETTLTDTSTGIELTYDSEVLAENVSLVVSPLTQSVGTAAFKDEYSRFSSFDISLQKGNEKVQPNGKVTVKIPLPEGYNAEITAVYYVAASGEKEKLESTYENGFIVFETDHFSEYVLVDEGSKVTPSQPDTCTCICHKHGKFYKIIYKIVRVFWKLFGINQTCACGKRHYY